MKILLIVTGSVAAYKACEIVRLARKQGHEVTCVLTKGGEQFITPLQLSALSENPTYDSLWSLKDEVEMGHIRLSRENDIILVAPASADIISKMATGAADDLATTTLLASDKPVYVAPAMNVQMWNKPATQRNITQIENDGAIIIEPREGDMACGEFGMGRMAEVEDILKEIGVGI